MELLYAVTREWSLLGIPATLIALLLLNPRHRADWRYAVALLVLIGPLGLLLLAALLLTMAVRWAKRQLQAMQRRELRL